MCSNESGMDSNRMFMRGASKSGRTSAVHRADASILRPGVGPAQSLDRWVEARRTTSGPQTRDSTHGVDTVGLLGPLVVPVTDDAREAQREAAGIERAC